jgi:hypothetical protein
MSSGPDTVAGILGARARYLRADVAALSAAELGTLCGLSDVGVLRMEQGSPPPSVALLQAALDAAYEARVSGVRCALRGWTVEELRAEAQAEAARVPAGRAA